DTLRGYVRDAELFKDHAGGGIALKGWRHSQLRQLKPRAGHWAFCGEGSCARAAWIGRGFGKGGAGGFCALCPCAPCTSWDVRTCACTPSSAAQAWNRLNRASALG